MRSFALVLTIALVGGCRHPPAAPVVLTVTADGVVVARLTTADLRDRRQLAALVPEPASWARLVARADDGRSMAIDEPAERYPDCDVVLYLDGDRPAIAIMRRRRADQPAYLRRALAQPEQALIGVVAIAVDHDGPAVSDAGPVEATGLVIVAGGTTRTLALESLPAARGADGWALHDVLAAAGIDGDVIITAVGRDGEGQFRTTDLAQPGVAATLRRNRRGELRLGIERPGAEPIQVRGVVRLEVEPAATP